jgi:hypothetical protein
MNSALEGCDLAYTSAFLLKKYCFAVRQYEKGLFPSLFDMKEHRSGPLWGGTRRNRVKKRLSNEKRNIRLK